MSSRKKFLEIQVLPNLATRRNHYTVVIDKRMFPRTKSKLMKWMQNPDVCSVFKMDRSFLRYLGNLKRRSFLINERYEDFFFSIKSKFLCRQKIKDVLHFLYSHLDSEVNYNDDMIDETLESLKQTFQFEIKVIGL